MIETGDPAEVIIEMGGYKMVSDRDQIAAAVAAAIAANPQADRRAEAGQEEARGRQGLPPRPGHEADRRQGQPRARGRAARGQARGAAGSERTRIVRRQKVKGKR